MSDDQPAKEHPRRRPESQAQADARQQRLADQLRANLAKRKRQKQLRAEGAGDGSDADGTRPKDP